MNPKGRPRVSSRIYFFEKEDGAIFPIDGDKEAWKQYAHPRCLYVGEKPPRLIGTSDGKQFNTKVAEANLVAKTDMEGAKKIISDAMLEEIEIARKTVVPPPNHDRMDNRGNPSQF